MNQFGTANLSTYHPRETVMASGNRVMNERADTLVTRAGKKAVVPAAGFFEIKEGKIFAWRDYFDLQTFTKQME
jgi:limonene-1,2-epoxide hydrolase